MALVYVANGRSFTENDFDMRQFQSDAIDFQGHVARVGPQISQNQQTTNKKAQ